MLWENESRYSMQETEEILIRKAAENGWRVPKVHDLQETLKNNGYDVLQVKVMEICKPAHAFEILSRNSERIASPLMPCRIAIFERPDGKVYISRMNSGVIGKFMHGVIPSMMKKATSEMEDIINAVINQ